MFGKKAEASFGTQIIGGHAKELGLTLGRVDQAHQHLDGGGFSCAVGAEESEDLALMDGERKVTYSADAFAKEADAKLFAEVLDFDDGGLRVHKSLRCVGRSGWGSSAQRIPRLGGVVVGSVFFFVRFKQIGERVEQRYHTAPCLCRDQKERDRVL